jgi:ubiquinone/menaquinone biosynthesis C-methylase UbiE
VAISTQQRLRQLLEPSAQPVDRAGYLDVLGDAPQAGPSTGVAQRLMRTSAVPRVYERWWRPALGRVAKGAHGPSMAEEHRLAAQLLALRPGHLVLDVACGTGAFTRGFARTVGADGLAVGLDGSRSMLARAAEQTADREPVAFLRADAVRPPLTAGSLDAVCCFAALHLFAEPEAALESFARLLRPGGRLAVLTSARRGWQPARLFDSTVGAVGGMRMFERGEVTDLLRSRGFDDVSERFAGVVQIVGARRG